MRSAVQRDVDGLDDRYESTGCDESRFDGHLQDAAGSLSKKSVAFRNLIGREPMRQQRSKIHATAPNNFHQTSHPFFSAWGLCRFVEEQRSQKLLPALPHIALLLKQPQRHSLKLTFHR